MRDALRATVSTFGALAVLEDTQEIAQKLRKVSLFQVGLRPNANLEQVEARIELLEKGISVSAASEYQGGQEWTAMLEGFAWTKKNGLVTYLGANPSSHYRFAMKVLRWWLRGEAERNYRPMLSTQTNCLV